MIDKIASVKKMAGSGVNRQQTWAVKGNNKKLGIHSI